MCANFNSPMQEDSPEILLMQLICAGKTIEACALFGETKQFGGLPAVDAPYGRFEGQEELAVFASGWLKRFNAESASIEPVCQTQSGGRSVTEMNVSFVTDGMRSILRNQTANRKYCKDCKNYQKYDYRNLQTL